MSVRCFTAIELPLATREALVAGGELIRSADPRWRGDKWVAEPNLHITLTFVGHIAEDDVDVLVRACRQEVAAIPRFSLAVDRIVAVPRAKKARMLWASFGDADGTCQRLADATGRAALAVGIAPEDRPFRAHATLVRARMPHPVLAEALESANDALSRGDRAVSVSAVTVFKSTLGNGGPTYETLAICPLAE